MLKDRSSNIAWHKLPFRRCLHFRKTTSEFANRYFTTTIYNHINAQSRPYIKSFESNIIVNGPSFSKVIFISAPKEPVCTSGTSSRHFPMIYSYNSLAFSGLPAFTKDGRFPLRQSAYNVNCETNKRDPFTSFRLKFVLPFSSAKSLIPIAF